MGHYRCRVSEGIWGATPTFVNHTHNGYRNTLILQLKFITIKVKFPK